MFYGYIVDIYMVYLGHSINSIIHNLMGAPIRPLSNKTHYIWFELTNSV